MTGLREDGDEGDRASSVLAAIGLSAVALVALFCDDLGAVIFEEERTTGRPPPLVEATRVTPRRIDDEISVTGSLVSPKRVMITA